MKELSLFSGMGGGIYGALILGWETAAYVEKNEYCRKVIDQRIKDGWFDKAPIYGDIKEFNEKHAHEYTDKIDVLTGGFPCQPFSVAGKRQGANDERYLFDQIIKTIQIVRPRQLFFENVKGLLTDPAIIDIYRSITSLGYDVKPPLVLGSDDCGNIHHRKRVWIFADTKEQQRNAARHQLAKHKKQQKSELRNCTEQLLHTNSQRERIQRCEQKKIQRQPSLRTSSDCPMYLSPYFAEWMMNYPTGSSNLKPLATGKTQS